MIRLPDLYDLTVEGDPLGRKWRFICPNGWTHIKTMERILAYFGLPNECTVAVNAWMHNAQVWLHASIAYPNRLPNYDDLCMLKVSVFGQEGIAYQVFEARSNHVNIHPNCLHLFGPLDPNDWPLPRFTDGTI